MIEIIAVPGRYPASISRERFTVNAADQCRLRVRLALYMASTIHSPSSPMTGVLRTVSSVEPFSGFPSVNAVVVGVSSGIVTRNDPH